MAVNTNISVVSDVTPCKGYSNPCSGWDRLWVLTKVEASRFQDNGHMNVVRSAEHTGRFIPKDRFLHSFLLRAESTPGTWCGRIDCQFQHYELNRDLPVCSAVRDAV
jgi:hypothetical protein